MKKLCVEKQCYPCFAVSLVGKKPKEEIKNIALEYKESLQHNMQKWNEGEFVDFMINLNQKYIYKF